MKIKTITLQGPAEISASRFNELDVGKTQVAYWITKVTDSIEFSPNTWIKKQDVETLCDMKDWKVTIVGGNSR